MSSIDHILLYIIMLALAAAYDYYRRAKARGAAGITRRDTLLTFALLTLVFLFTEGMRYGRGVDQVTYGQSYLFPQFISADLRAHNGAVWGVLNHMALAADPTTDLLPYGLIFVVYAAVFWTGLWRFTKLYEGESRWMLLLSILSLNFLIEWAVRQGVSLAFVFLTVVCMERRKWLPMLLCMYISFNIHPGNTLTLLLLVGFYLCFNKRTLPWTIMVPLFLLLEYTVQLSVIEQLTRLLSATFDSSLIGRGFSHYADEDVLNADAEHATETISRTLFTQGANAMFYSAILVLCDKVGRLTQKHTYVLNAVAVGAFIYEPFHTGGSLFRLFLPLQAMWFVPLALALYYYKDHKKDIVLRLAIYVSFAYILMFYGRYIFLNPEASYVWRVI